MDTHIKNRKKIIQLNNIFFLFYSWIKYNVEHKYNIIQAIQPIIPMISTSALIFWNNIDS